MKTIILTLFYVLFIFSSSFTQNEFTVKNESGIYLIRDDLPQKIKSVSYETYYGKDSHGDLDISEYYYFVKMDNVKIITIKVFLRDDAVCLEITNPDNSINYLCIELLEFKKSSTSSNFWYKSLVDEKFTRIVFEKNMKVFIIIDIPIQYKNKTHLLHLKPHMI